MYIYICGWVNILELGMSDWPLAILVWRGGKNQNSMANNFVAMHRMMHQGPLKRLMCNFQMIMTLNHFKWSMLSP